MSKKIISLLLVMIMALSLVACAGSPAETTTTTTKGADDTADATTAAPTESKDPVTINYWYRNGGGVGDAQQAVEDELNRILSETPGYEYITIKLHPCADLATDVTLQLADDPTQVDLITTFGNGSIIEKVRDGEYMALDELLAANPEVTADLPDWFVDYGVYDGKMYIVPNYQQVSNQAFYYTAKDFLDEAGYTEEQFREIVSSGDIDTRAKMMEDLAAAGNVLGYPNVYCRADDISNARMDTGGFGNTQVQFSWYAYIYWDDEAQEGKFTEFNEDVIKGYEYNAKWYDSGLLYPDPKAEGVFESGNQFHSDVNSNLSTCLQETYGTDEMVSANLSEKYGYEIVAARLPQPIVLPAENAAGGVAVCSACQHPEEAVKVLALLFNKKYEQFYNTLVYGLEGQQYEKLTDTTVKTLEYDSGQCNVPDCSYSYWKWTGGNTFNAWNNQSLTEEAESYIIENINNNPDNITTLVGFRFDDTEVQTEIEQITAIVGEYSEALRYGQKGEAGWRAWYDEYVGKLQTAGIQKVLDAYNEQVTAFLASK